MQTTCFNPFGRPWRPYRSAAKSFTPTLFAVAWLSAVALLPRTGQADETCMSPYMPKITGQEEFIYVWTLGDPEWGDGSDKLVTIDVRPGSTTYQKVIHSVSVGGRHEAHHGGFTDDRRHLWMSGLDTSYIFIFDVATNPARPKLVKTIKNFARKPRKVFHVPGVPLEVRCAFI